jgi:SH3-like domain-containing protein
MFPFHRHAVLLLSKLRVGFNAILIVFMAASGAVYAVDYVSVNDKSAILYDAPSLKAKKIFIANRYLPLEQVVILDTWVKVRDHSGSLSWIEKKALSNKHYVLVTSEWVALHQAPEEKSAVMARIKQQVALEFQENNGMGWLKVRLLEGATGYVKAAEVWGY